jgi:hypothetical protein
MPRKSNKVAGRSDAQPLALEITPLLPNPDNAASVFINERLKQSAGTNWGDALARALIDLTRSDIPLDASVRPLLADMLEHGAFPSPPAEMRRDIRQRKARFLWEVIELFAATQGTSQAQIKAKFAPVLGCSPEALNQFLKREKREHKKGDKKL